MLWYNGGWEKQHKGGAANVIVPWKEILDFFRGDYHAVFKIVFCNVSFIIFVK